MKFSHKSQHCESGYMGPLGHDSLRLQATMSWAALLPWHCQKRQTREVLLDWWPWLTLTLPANAIHISLFMSTQNLCHTYNVRDFRSDKLEEEDEEKETPPLKKREKPKKLKSKTEIHCQECIILAVLKLSIPNAWKGSDSVLQTISEDANEVGEFYHLGSSALPSFCELGESLQTSPDDQYVLPEDKSDTVTLPPLHLHSVMIPPPYSQLSLSLS